MCLGMLHIDGRRESRFRGWEEQKPAVCVASRNGCCLSCRVPKEFSRHVTRPTLARTWPGDDVVSDDLRDSSSVWLADHQCIYPRPLSAIMVDMAAAVDDDMPVDPGEQRRGRRKKRYAAPGLSSGIVHTLGLGFWSLARVLLFHTLNLFQFRTLPHARRWFLGFYKRAAGLQHPFCGVSSKPYGKLRDLGTRRDQKPSRNSFSSAPTRPQKPCKPRSEPRKRGATSSWDQTTTSAHATRDSTSTQRVHCSTTNVAKSSQTVTPWDEFDPLGDELSDGEEDDTDPPEDREDAQHDVTVKPEPSPEDTDTLPEPAVPRC